MLLLSLKIPLPSLLRSLIRKEPLSPWILVCIGWSPLSPLTNLAFKMEELWRMAFYMERVHIDIGRQMMYKWQGKGYHGPHACMYQNMFLGYDYVHLYPCMDTNNLILMFHMFSCFTLFFFFLKGHHVIQNPYDLML